MSEAISNAAATAEAHAATGSVQGRGTGSPGVSKSDRARMFLTSSAFDFALVLVLSSLLAFTVSYGFESAAEYRGNLLLIAAIEAPVILALFAGSWSKRAVLPSAVATAALVFAIVIASAALTPADVPIVVSFDDGVINDVADCYVLFGVVLAITPVVTYLLSRRAWGLVLLLAATVLACGLVQFLWRDWAVDQPGIAAAIGALFCVLMLFVFQTYKQSVYSAKRAKRTSFPGAFMFAAGVSVLSVAVGLAVFYGLISGLGIETPNLKPFTYYWSAPVEYVTEIHDTNEIEGDDESSNEGEDKDEDSRDISPGSDSGNAVDAAGVSDASNPLQILRNAFDASNWNQQYDPINYQIVRIAVYIVCGLILALLIGAILLQRHRREWRLKRLASVSRPYAIWGLYEFLLGRLARLGFAKPEHLTPMEYALGFGRQLAPFAQGTGGVDFADVTNIYQRSCFGEAQVTDEEYEGLVRYYRAFFKNARKHVGWPKWLLYKYWRV